MIYYCKSLLLIFLVLLGGCVDVEDSPMLELDSCQFRMVQIDGDGSTPSLEWERLQLPDVWNSSRPDIGGMGIYRFELNLNVVPDRLWALLLPRVSTNAEVYLNGELLACHGEFTDYSTTWNHPFYVTIPNRLLHSGTNIIDVKVAAKANNFGRLHTVFVGPDVDIKHYYQMLYNGQISLGMICAVFALTMGISLLLIWWYRRESLYGWFALGGLFWSVYSLYFFVSDLPLPLSDWIRFCFACGFLMSGSMLIFICQFMGWQKPLRDKLIIGYSVFSALLGFILPDDQVFHGIRWIYGGYAAFYFLLGIALINALRFERSKHQATVSLIGIGLNIGLGIHDWANIFFVLHHSYLLQYGQPLIFLVMGRHLLKNYMSALHESEATNAALDRRVYLREQELHASLQKTKQVEQEKLLLKERERIMADIHDGVGGHLISALSIAEASASSEGALVSQTIHQALDELRIVIDSLDPDERKLSQMLAAFRHRYEQRLQRQGIDSNWKFEKLDQLDQVGPEKALQLLRILQELMSNIVKHAEADQVSVRVGISDNPEGQACWLSVVDNGIGFDTTASLGRGLGNLKRRAEAIGGHIKLSSEGIGVVAKLVFPMSSVYVSEAVGGD